MAYDQYRDIPQNLRPTQADAMALSSLASIIKEAARVRHDIHTAQHVGDTLAVMQEALMPAILRRGAPAERHLGPPPAWESAFGRSMRPDAKTLAGLAGEHQRLYVDAKAMVAKVRNNAKLAMLLKTNIEAFFPDVGVNAHGAVRRLRKDNKSIIDAFHPLGVEDTANIIRLLMKRKFGTYFYW